MSHISSSSATVAPGTYLDSITGNAGGAVGADVAGNVGFTGTDPITVTGTPGTNSLAITIANSTKTQIGAVELATNAETILGTSATLAVTPDDLTAKLGVQTNHGLPTSAGASASFSWTAEPANGQILIGSTGNAPSLGTITAGAGINVTNAAGSITIANTGFMLAWSEVVAVGPTGMAVGSGYITNNAALVTMTLPAVAALGDIIQVAGKGAGGWLIAQNAGQTIHFGILDTTPGVGGSLASTQTYDNVKLLCITANSDFAVIYALGNLTVV